MSINRYWESPATNYLYGPKVNPPPNYPQKVVRTPYNTIRENCNDNCLCSSIVATDKRYCLSLCQIKATQNNILLDQDRKVI